MDRPPRRSVQPRVDAVAKGVSITIRLSERPQAVLGRNARLGASRRDGDELVAWSGGSVRQRDQVNADGV